MNEEIRAPKVRVVAPTGEQLGVHDTKFAIQKAKERGLDLVEISPTVRPPVCKIVNYGKYKYEQSKLKKPKTNTKMKGIQFRVGTEENDYNIKMSRAESFLDAGHKVRIQIMFKGRENAHKEIGFTVMDRVKEDFKTMAQVDQEPRINGRFMIMVVSPLPKDQRVRKFKKVKFEDLEEDDIEHHEDEELEIKNLEGDDASEESAEEKSEDKS